MSGISELRGLVAEIREERWTERAFTQGLIVTALTRLLNVAEAGQALTRELTDDIDGVSYCRECGHRIPSCTCFIGDLRAALGELAPGRVLDVLDEAVTS